MELKDVMELFYYKGQILISDFFYFNSCFTCIFILYKSSIFGYTILLYFYLFIFIY